MRLHIKRLGTIIGFTIAGASTFVVVSSFGIAAYTTFCDKFSTSKYSLPSASVTEIISVVVSGKFILLNLKKFPKFSLSISSVRSSPETT